MRKLIHQDAVIRKLDFENAVSDPMIPDHCVSVKHDRNKKKLKQMQVQLA